MKTINKAFDLKFSQIEINDSFEFFYKLDDSVVSKFAKLIGDFNPLHMDEGYARKTQFKGRIAHGMLVASLFSTLFGMYYPGKRSLLLSLTFNFLKPVRINSKLLVKGIVLKKIDALKILLIKTLAFNEKDELVLEGQAKVRVLG